uniref:Rho GTPase activating protein 15 n=1 Tax=Equus asinus TaxID=9793 RepID=A0A9L0J7T8_EQUAS
MQKSTDSDTSMETLNSPRQGTGAVQMRIKNANSHHDRLSQSKSMILTDVGKVTAPISRHRRNHSQHVLKDVIPPLEQLMVEKEGYLQKAKIADGGKKLRKLGTNQKVWICVEHILNGPRKNQAERTSFRSPQSQEMSSFSSQILTSSYWIGSTLSKMQLTDCQRIQAVHQETWNYSKSRDPPVLNY